MTKKRNFDEMISYFNRTVADMDIDRKYKMELLGLITAIVQTHEEEQQWIPCSERLPELCRYYITTTEYGEVYCDFWDGHGFDRTETVIAWMPLPSPYKEDE